MSDEKSPEPGAEPAKKVATEIAHCPELGFYHYRRADGAEFMFDTLSLEKAIEGYLQQGDERQAEFMVMLTTYARQFPHVVVPFDENGILDQAFLLERLREREAAAAASAPATADVEVLEGSEPSLGPTSGKG